VPPFITQVRRFPLEPRSTDAVITALSGPSPWRRSRRVQRRPAESRARRHAHDARRRAARRPPRGDGVRRESSGLLMTRRCDSGSARSSTAWARSVAEYPGP
jgi:hypothetical protein